MRSKYLALALAVGLCAIVAGLLTWFWPITGSGAISAAKSEQVYQLQARTYGDLIAKYEEATGIVGVWRAKRVGAEHYEWDVTYVHPGIGVLWFGVQHPWSVYTDDPTPGITRRMLQAIGETATGNAGQSTSQSITRALLAGQLRAAEVVTRRGP